MVGFWDAVESLDHVQTICTSLQTDNHTNTSSVNFYRPDAHPDAQPTVLKHCLLAVTVFIVLTICLSVRFYNK